MIKLKEIPKEERPRERLIANGASSLSIQELLAILLNTGSKKESVKNLADNILSKLDYINNLKDINYEFLISINGIGLSNACTILAAIELAYRLDIKYQTIKDMAFLSTASVFEYYHKKLNIMQECFYVIYLDNTYKVIKDKLLFMGTVNASLVHPREVFKEAYLLSAVAIICVHNHPSNNINPSKEDISTTYNLKTVGELLGIKLVDHIIIGLDKYYSFFENGNLK